MCNTGRSASRPIWRRSRSTSRKAAISRILVFTPARPTRSRSRPCSTSSRRESRKACPTSSASSLAAVSAIALSRGLVGGVRIERVPDHLPAGLGPRHPVALLVDRRAVDDEREHLALAERRGIEAVHLDVAAAVAAPALVDLEHHRGGV